MTIALSNSNPIQYAGNGAAVTFSYPWKLSAATDLVVGFITGGTYVQQTSGYTVSGVGNNGGGSITFAVAPPNGTTVDLRPSTPQTQPTEFANLAAYLPENTTNAVDRLTREVQDLTRISYTFGIKGPDTESVAWTTLPGAVGRANGALLFDSNGLPTIGVLTSSPLTQPVFNSFLAGAQLFPQTSAESAAGITPTNYSYQPLDIRRYGADSTGVSASDNALAAALSVANQVGGATIRAPFGLYTFASTINLFNDLNIVIQGDAGQSAGSAPGTIFNYSGTASPFINMGSASGCQLKGLQLQTTNAAFTGTMVQLGQGGSNGPANFTYIADCTFAPTSASVHIDVGNSLETSVDRCNFSRGNPSIRGAQNGAFTNVISFRNCQWVNGATAAVQIAGPNQAWKFDTCTFEGLASGAAGGILSTAATGQFLGLEVSGCWFGDVTAGSGGTWIDTYIQGGTIHANYFSGNSGTPFNSSAINLEQSFGVLIEGNSFTSFLNAINFGQAGCAEIVVKGNVLNSTTTPWGNPGNAIVGLLEFYPNFGFGIPTGHGLQATNGYRVGSDGIIEQWGTAFNQRNGTNTLTFPLPFPNACYNVQCTLSGVVATTATIFASIPTLTNVVVTIQDSSTTTDSFYWRAIGR